MNFNSDKEFQIKAAPQHQSNQGEEVFFIVNMKELFNISLDFPNIKRAINMAFMEGKAYTPIDTGLMRKSMTVIQLDSDRVKIFFDKNKIVGKTRKGVVVKEYYPIFLAEKPKTFNWLAIVIKHFYDELYRQVKLIKKSKTKNTDIIDYTTFIAFMEEFNMEYKAKKKIAKDLRDEQRKKQQLLAEEVKRRKRLKNESLDNTER